MRTTRLTLRLSVLAVLVAVVGFLWTAVPPQRVQAQGYSGALPNVTAAAGTSLRLPYTAGQVFQGGAATTITADATGLLATGSMTSCAAPAYSACNFVYWTSGTALAITTTASTAFAPGNVVVAFVTTTSNDINVITPASRSPWIAANTQRPTGSQIGGAYWVPPGNCWYSVATGTLTTPTFGAAPGNTALGLNTVGASFMPVMQVATTNAAVISTNTISCVINPPSTIGVSGRGVTLTDAVVVYGLQQAGGVNATQQTVAASGTFNGTIVFTKIALPTPGASETPSTVTPVRADAGTLVYTPAGASFNSAVTTAGSFATQQFTPATPFGLTTDLTIYHLNFAVLCNTTQATTLNVAGILVHFTS